MAGVVGASPSNLAKPKPGAEEVDALDSFLASYKAPEAAQAEPAMQEAAPAEQAAPEVDPLDEFLAGVPEAPLTPDMVAEEPEAVANIRQQFGDIAGAGASLGMQIKEAGTRFKASFARSDKELNQVLTEKYGEGNVKKVADDGDTYFLVKRPGDKKYTKFDSDSFEVVGDLLDFGRDAVEEVIAAPATALAAGIATAGTVGTGGLGTVPALAGAAAVRAGGAAGSMAIADWLSETIGGIEQDPTRNKAAEYVIGGGLSAFFGGFGDMLGKFARGKKAAKELLESQPNISKQAETAIEGLGQAVKTLKAKGLISPVTGTNIYATAEQFNPFDPAAAKAVGNLSDVKAVQTFYENQADMIKTAITKQAEAVGNLSARGTGQAFSNYVENLDKASGQLIGKFRKDLVKNAGDMDIPVDKFKGAIQQLSESMGFRLEKGRMIVPDPDVLVEKGIVSNVDEAKTLLKRIEGFENMIYSTEGKLTPNKMQSVRKEIQDITNRVFKDKNASHEHRGILLRLKNAIVDDEMIAIEKNISPEAMEAFAGAKQIYSGIRKGEEQLGKILEQDGVTSKALMGEIFSGKPGALDSMTAVKGILAGNPTLWNKIKGEYVGLALDAATDANGVMGAKKFYGQMDKLPPEIRKELFPDEKTYNALKKLAYRVEDSWNGGKPSPGLYGQLKQGAVLATAGNNSVALKAGMDLLSNVFGALSKDEAAAKWLTQEGVEKIVAAAKKPHQTKLRNAIYKAMEVVGTAQSQRKGWKAVVPTASGAFGRTGVKQGVRDFTEGITGYGPAEEPSIPMERPQE